MSEITELRTRISEDRDAWPGVRWRCSRELRHEIEAVATKLISEEWTVSRLARELGVAPGTVRRWIDHDTRGSHRGFRRVDLAEAEVQQMTLVTPTGYRVEGLGFGQLRELLASLG